MYQLNSLIPVPDLPVPRYLQNFPLTLPYFLLQRWQFALLPVKFDQVLFKDEAIRIEFFDNEVERILIVDIITGRAISKKTIMNVFPATLFATSEHKKEEAIKRIKNELVDQIAYFKENNKLLEAQRIEQRTRYDIEMLEEVGTCSGIENYSRHFSLREEGETPYTLIDFFKKDFLLVVDESHVSLPQVRGMYNGDRSRKMNLVENGFRLPSALDNRPLRFEEFQEKLDKVIYLSATPSDFEKDRSSEVIEQIIRPTGLLDPVIEEIGRAHV